jgi:hypothetical protein
MNRIPTKSNTITIDSNQPADAATIKKINAFKRRIKPNERIQVVDSGTSITYSRYIESRSEKLSRKLNDFDQAIKSAFAVVRDSLTTKNTGASGESIVVTSNIKTSQPSKSNLVITTSISIKKFNALVESQTNRIPVLKGLQQPHVRIHLGEILNNITFKKIDNSLISQIVSSNDAELKAFIGFVKAQEDKQSMNNAVEVKKAINFAKQWVKEAENTETKTVLNRCMSKETLTALSVVAKELVKLDSGT